jgi:hypothetical protein
MKPLIIPIHSFVDVITNSSTEIYVSADEDTVEAIYALIDNLLKMAGSTMTAEQLSFKVEMVYPIYTTMNGKYDRYFLTEKELKNLVADKVVDEEDIDYLLNPSDHEVYSKRALRVTNSTNSPEALEACKTLSNLPGLFSIEAVENR